jgi:hypothetical protein
MHFFVVLLACKSVDRSTFCMKRDNACNMNAFFSFDIFMVCILECKQQLIIYKNYEIIHALLSQRSAIISDLDVILHDFMLQIIYTMYYIYIA